MSILEISYLTLWNSILGRTDNDSLEDFEGGYDFEKRLNHLSYLNLETLTIIPKTKHLSQKPTKKYSNIEIAKTCTHTLLTTNPSFANWLFL